VANVEPETPVSNPADTPYSGLNPDCVLDAVESLGLVTDGRVQALNSYENRVYQIGIDEQTPIIAKFYRPGRWTDEGIMEEHAFSAELVDNGLEIVAPMQINGSTLHRHEDYRFALFPRRSGHAPEVDDRATLTMLGRTIARMHSTGVRDRFKHRPTLSIQSHGRAPVDFLVNQHWVPESLRRSFVTLTDALFPHLEAAWERADHPRQLRLHGDLHLGNLLFRDKHLWIVDLDDCLTGPAIQDLWMLLSGERDDRRDQVEWLLEGYEEFRDFNRSELQLIEPLRTLRLLHFNGWLARRWHDPAFPMAFPWFDSPRHWESVIVQLQEQLSALQEA